MKKWTIEDSKELYNINGWGTSYFGINEKGDVYVSPCKNNTQIDLREVMDELALRDVTPPVLLRFPDILDNRIALTRVLCPHRHRRQHHDTNTVLIKGILCGIDCNIVSQNCIGEIREVQVVGFSCTPRQDDHIVVKRASYTVG